MFNNLKLNIKDNSMQKSIIKLFLQRIKMISYLRLYRISNLHLDVKQQVKYIFINSSIF